MNDKFAHIFQEAHNAGREMAAAGALVGGKFNQLPGAIAMAMAPVAGALQTVAMALAPAEDRRDPEVWVPSPDQMMFAAIFTVVCVGNGNGLVFAPESFAEAFHVYEKATGKKPDSLVMKNFADFTRKAEETGNVPLAAFMEARRNGTNH